jgi:hypothetical protein
MGGPGSGRKKGSGSSKQSNTQSMYKSIRKTGKGGNRKSNRAVANFSRRNTGKKSRNINEL